MYLICSVTLQSCNSQILQLYLGELLTGNDEDSISRYNTLDFKAFSGIQRTILKWKKENVKCTSSHTHSTITIIVHFMWIKSGYVGKTGCWLSEWSYVKEWGSKVSRTVFEKSWSGDFFVRTALKGIVWKSNKVSYLFLRLLFKKVADLFELAFYSAQHAQIHSKPSVTKVLCVIQVSVKSQWYSDIF